jgi:hypothetical protein
MRNNFYNDRRCADGVFASGWRYVKKGGRVKVAGTWYADEKLKEIVGEFVHVQMGEYWMSHVQISRGAMGCMGWFCNAKTEEKSC